MSDSETGKKNSQVVLFNRAVLRLKQKAARLQFPHFRFRLRLENGRVQHPKLVSALNGELVGFHGALATAGEIAHLQICPTDLVANPSVLVIRLAERLLLLPTYQRCGEEGDQFECRTLSVVGKGGEGSGENQDGLNEFSVLLNQFFTIHQ